MALTASEKQDIKNKIDAAKQQIPAIEQEINRAHMAGLDVSDYRNRLAQLKTTVQKLELQYGK